MSTIKTLKRINERLAVYQRQGLTDSAKYNKIVDKIKLLEIPYSETKGRFKISMKKSDIAKMNLEDLATLDSMPTLKEERKHARELGYKTTKEQNEYIINRGSFVKWAENNLDQVYIDAKSGIETAIKLDDIFKEEGKGKGTRNMSYDAIWKLVDAWKKEKDKIFEELHGSNFNKNKNDIHDSNDIHGDN